MDNFVISLYRRYQELKETKEFTDPGDKVEDGDEVLGEMTKNQKIIYTILRETTEKLENKSENLQEDFPSPMHALNNPEEFEERCEAIEDLKDRRGAIKEILGAEVRRKFGHRPRFGLRKGFKVAVPEEADDGDFSLLDMMLPEHVP